MMDSGGDSGRLRDEFGVLPLGDVRRCLEALSAETGILKSLCSFRFEDPPLRGRNFGNLFLLALTKKLGSEKPAIEALGRILRIRGKVIPVTWDHVNLCAELADGAVVVGEAHIDVPKHDPFIPIKRVYLDPVASANPDAVAAVEKSDFVVFAPGNLFTSTIPNLLVKGIPEAVQGTRAKIVYVVNLMTVRGETDGYQVFDHVDQIAGYAGRVPDALLINSDNAPLESLSKNHAGAGHRVKIGDMERLHRMGIEAVKREDIISRGSMWHHDPARTAKALLDLFGQIG